MQIFRNDKDKILSRINLKLRCLGVVGEEKDYPSCVANLFLLPLAKPPNCHDLLEICNINWCDLWDLYISISQLYFCIKSRLAFCKIRRCNYVWVLVSLPAMPTCNKCLPKIVFCNVYPEPTVITVNENKPIWDVGALHLSQCTVNISNWCNLFDNKNFVNILKYLKTRQK